MLPEAEARQRYGNRLSVASLGALDKSNSADGATDIRIIHDGTHGVVVNHLIKARGTIPTHLAGGIKCCLHRMVSQGIPLFGFTVDAKEAHRCVGIRPQDWPLLACQVCQGGKIYLNKQGFYGIYSAAYWWGRLAAALHRAVLHTAGSKVPLWLHLFADDWFGAVRNTNLAKDFLLFLWFLVVLRVPVSWNKVSLWLLGQLDRL